jgi:hypothetical protein
VTDDPDVQVFLLYSGRYMDINSLYRGWEENFVEKMTVTLEESLRAGFRRGFAKSLDGQVTPREYEKATGWDFDTPEEFHEHLSALWRTFYGEADPAASLN